MYKLERPSPARKEGNLSESGEWWLYPLKSQIVDSGGGGGERTYLSKRIWPLKVS